MLSVSFTHKDAQALAPFILDIDKGVKVWNNLVDAGMASDVENLLGSCNITSHFTLIGLGVISSMMANDVKIGVENFASNNPKASMEALATLRNTGAAE